MNDKISMSNQLINDVFISDNNLVPTALGKIARSFFYKYHDPTGHCSVGAKYL